LGEVWEISRGNISGERGRADDVGLLNYPLKPHKTPTGSGPKLCTSRVMQGIGESSPSCLAERLRKEKNPNSQGMPNI